MRERAELVNKEDPGVSIRKQCQLLGVTRSRLSYEAVQEREEDRKIKRLMDEIYLRDPCVGTRRLVALLKRDHAVEANRKRLQRLRREMGLETIWCQPRTSVPAPTHRKYPYLLRNLKVERPNQVWCADITYVPMPQGHAYRSLRKYWPFPTQFLEGE